MPKIVDGTPPFVGTRDNLTIYLMNGEYIIRAKSSLTGKRVKHDPAFAKTMKYAGWLKQGARIASRIYRQLPNDTRAHKRYRELTGRAMSLLKEGFDTEDVITMLEAVYLTLPIGSTADCGDKCCEYCSEYIAGNDIENHRVNSSGISRISKVSCNSGKYDNEYGRGYNGKHSRESVNYCNRQIKVCIDECDYRGKGKFNSIHSREHNFITRAKCYSEGLKGMNESVRLSVEHLGASIGEYNREARLDYMREWNYKAKCREYWHECRCNMNIHMNICSLTIVLETGRSERCRRESLALVV